MLHGGSQEEQLGWGQIWVAESPFLPFMSSPLSQVAIIAGNFELAEVIKTHKDSDVGEFCPTHRSFLVLCLS